MAISFSETVNNIGYLLIVAMILCYAQLIKTFRIIFHFLTNSILFQDFVTKLPNRAFAIVHWAVD